MKKFLSSFNSKSLRVGGYSVVATVILVVAVVFANILVTALPTKYTSFDVSRQQLYTLSEESEKIGRSATQDVTFYWIVQEGAEDAATQNLLQRYIDLNSRFTLEKVDPDLQPGFIDQYDITYLYNNSLVVESGDRFRYIKYTDIYDKVYDYNSYDPDTGSYKYEQVFDGEHVITSALNFVLNEELPKIYQLTGHNETDLIDDYTEGIKDENFDIEELSLATTDGIPEDCSILMILNPQSDLSETEIEMIREYLQAGGNMFLVTGLVKEDHPNLKALMSEDYHVTEETGVVIEGNADYYASRYPQYYLVPKILDSDITAPISDSNLNLFFPKSTGLTVGTQYLKETITKLLKTSSSSFSKVAGYNISTFEKEEGDIDGPFYTGVLIEMKVGENDEGLTKIIWYSSEGVISEDANSMSSGANLNLVLNSLTYMTGQTDSISIHSKSLQTDYLNVKASESIVHSVIMVGVIPALFLAAGIVITLRRRKK